MYRYKLISFFVLIINFKAFGLTCEVKEIPDIYKPTCAEVVEEKIESSCAGKPYGRDFKSSKYPKYSNLLEDYNTIYYGGDYLKLNNPQLVNIKKLKSCMSLIATPTKFNNCTIKWKKKSSRKIFKEMTKTKAWEEALEYTNKAYKKTLNLFKSVIKINGLFI